MKLWNLALQVGAAFMGTMAFSLLFHVKEEHFPLCGVTGGCGWLCFLLVRPYCSIAEACFFAAVVIMTLSRLFAIRKRCPVTVFLIAGIFPLVPGAGVYWTAYYAITQQPAQALAKGLETLQIAVAIVLGIVFISEIPSRFFRKKASPSSDDNSRGTQGSGRISL